MPVNVSRTATEGTWRAFESIEPGDVFFTVGGGLVGQLIRHGTASPYGHCGVVHAVTDEKDGTTTLHTAEAFPAFPPWAPGLRYRSRRLETVSAVARVWRTVEERFNLLHQSRRLVDLRLPYAWSEIAVIAAAVLLPHRLIPQTDVSTAVICSNHVASCIKYARPDYNKYFRYPPHQEWPGGVHFDLQAMLFDDNYGTDGPS